MAGQTDRFNHFSGPGGKHMSYSRNFLYNIQDYSTFNSLKDIEKKYLDSLGIAVIHYDNNDIKTPYLDRSNYVLGNLYHPATSFVLYSLFLNKLLEEKMKQNKLKLLKENLVTNIDYTPFQNSYIDSICKISNLGRILEFRELGRIFNCLREKKYSNLLDYEKTKVKRKKTKIKKNYLKSEQSILNSDYMAYLEQKRSLLLPSLGKPCKSKQDFRYLIDHSVEAVGPEKTLIFAGDQPVYEECREKYPAFPGKFHIKENMLMGIMIPLHLNGLDFLREKHFKVARLLLNVPKGWFKKSEQIVLNAFFLGFSYCKDVSQKFGSGQKFDFKAFHHYISNSLGGHKIPDYENSTADISQVFITTFGILFPYYLLCKAIKTADFNLYVLAIKKLLPVCAMTYRTNYLRILIKHLYDIKYKWTKEMVEIFELNLAYQSLTSNFISYDEFTEIINKLIKPAGTTKSIKRLVFNSEIYNILSFAKEVYKQENTYPKRKILLSLFDTPDYKKLNNNKKYENPIREHLKLNNFQFTYPTRTKSHPYKYEKKYQICRP